MESPRVPPGAPFLQAALRGNLPLLKSLAAQVLSRAGEGPGKSLCASWKTPDGHNALHIAAYYGRTEVCRYLIEELNFDVNCPINDGDTPLFHASLEKHLPTIICLIEKGGDVTRRNRKGVTALHQAAGQGSREIITRLISAGGDVNAISQGGVPLHNAALHGNVEALKCLLDFKADPNLISPMYASPLMHAMVGESIDSMRLLLEAGANPNEDCSRSQVTPLCFAVTKKHAEEMIKCLLNAGANPNMTDPMGETALEQAASLGRRELVQLLFPVTSRIPHYPEWTIGGLMKHLQSKAAIELRMFKLIEQNKMAKERGKKSFERKDYVDAMYWYTQAIEGEPIPMNAKALSSRSLCYTLLNDGELALADAKACIQLEPGWEKAHYREGAAWRVLKDYKKAAEAFSRALKLAPGNKEIESAYREALAEGNQGSN